MIDVVEGCQSLFQNTLARVKEGVRDKLSHSGIDYSDVGELDSAFDLPDPFKGLDTIYLQDTSKNKYVVTGKVSALHPLAGLGEVCSNVAAVLLFLETTVRINGTSTCTQQKCWWVVSIFQKSVDVSSTK